MDSADPSKTTHPGSSGQQGHGVHLCKRCGWPFPKPLPSARHRRNHKKICGTVPGYTLLTHDSALQTQYSAPSSFSDDEHEQGSDGDSKPPCVKSAVSTSVNEGGSGRPLERKNMSADDVFADAVSEFADASASLGGDERFSIDTEIVSHKGVGMLDEDVAIIGGNVQASIDHEASRKPPQEGTTTSPNQEEVTSFPEIPDIVEDPMTDPCEENKRSNAVEGSDGLETGVTKIDDASAFIVAPVIVPVSKDPSESSEKVTEEKTIKDHAVVESEICQNEEKLDAKSGSETFMDDHFQDGKTVLHSIDEISGIPQTEFDKLLTDRAAEGSASTTPVISEVFHVPSITESNKDALESNQVVESSNEIEGGSCTSLSVDGIRAFPTAAGIETLETSLAHSGSGNGSEDLNEKDLISLREASANDGTSLISKTDENGQVGSIVANSNIVDPEPGYDKMGAVAEDYLIKVEGNVSENETKSDNMSLNISSSEEPVSVLPVVLVQYTSESESLQEERAVQLPLVVNSSLGDELTETTTVISKEVKLDVEDPASELKPVSHDVLLQKLEEDQSDDEPIESFPATESSSQSTGNNQVDDASKGTGQSQDPEKSEAVSVTDAPCEINSPNGSSLDGNWGSVSVVSTMSDAAAGDVKKMKDPQEGQSSDKHEMFNPPSFLTLIEPRVQKAAAASSTSVEVQNPQQLDSAKAAWFPSITNVPNDSHGRKKNEEIIAKVTNWRTGKQHSPLKTLLGEAIANSSNSNPSDAETKDKPPVKNGKPVSTVNSILGSEEPDHPKDKLDSSGKEWSPTGRYPDEIKGEKRKVKGKPYWAPFMCCSSVK